MAEPTDAVRRRMRSQRREGTTPELAIRRALHQRGRRYRVGLPVPGMARRSIDIAFPRQRLAVFVDGCFWHKCPQHSVPVKNNAAWWQDKLDRNVARDEETSGRLQDQGWTVLRIWEHVGVPDAVALVEEQLGELEIASGVPT